MTRKKEGTLVNRRGIRCYECAYVLGYGEWLDFECVLGDVRATGKLRRGACPLFRRVPARKGRHISGPRRVDVAYPPDRLPPIRGGKVLLTRRRGGEMLALIEDTDRRKRLLPLACVTKAGARKSGTDILPKVKPVW